MTTLIHAAAEVNPSPADWPAWTDQGIWELGPAPADAEPTGPGADNASGGRNKTTTGTPSPRPIGTPWPTRPAPLDRLEMGLCC